MIVGRWAKYKIWNGGRSTDEALSKRSASVTWEYGKFELTAKQMVLRIARQHHHDGDPDTWAREAISKESV